MTRRVDEDRPGGASVSGVMIMIVVAALVTAGIWFAASTTNAGAKTRVLTVVASAPMSKSFGLRSGIERCPSVGSSVAPSQLASIDFLNSKTGLGVWLTPTYPNCETRLAVTDDGGMLWRLAGAGLPKRADFALPPPISFTSQKVGFIVALGTIYATFDEGQHWASRKLGAVIWAVGRYGQDLWAIVTACQGFSRAPFCRDRLETATHPTGPWRQDGAFPASLASQGNIGLLIARLTPTQAVVVPAGATAPVSKMVLWATSDAGSTWSSLKNPCATWDFWPYSVASVGPSHLWLLCNGGGAAGNQVKALVQSVDAGKTWTLLALTQHVDKPGTLPLGDAGPLAVPSTTSCLWLALVNGLVSSCDGGKRWTGVSSVGPFNGAGFDAAFSFVSSRTGWLLVPGLKPVSLYRTTDGLHWSAVT
jgi:hypothetical protein